METRYRIKPECQDCWYFNARVQIVELESHNKYCTTIETVQIIHCEHEPMCSYLKEHIFNKAINKEE